MAALNILPPDSCPRNSRTQIATDVRSAPVQVCEGALLISSCFTSSILPAIMESCRALPVISLMQALSLIIGDVPICSHTVDLVRPQRQKIPLHL